MIKRRFYREEHGNKDEPSSSSSSSSSDEDDNVNGYEFQADADSPDESEDKAEVAEVKDNDVSSSSSGYGSEDSSAEEIDVDSSGLRYEDTGTGIDKEIRAGSQLASKRDANVVKKKFDTVAGKESEPAEMENFVLKFKSVYKCRICPQIVCLTEETMETHLNSKRHAQSEKLLKENRLKTMLNSDGEIENQETPAEMHARIMALAEHKPKKKNKGRQRQKKRSRKKIGGDVLDVEKAKGTQKRRKSDN